MSWTQIYYHIIFSTKDRKPSLNQDHKDDLLKYIWGIVKKQKCHLYRINCVADHIHLLSSLHPSVCLADLIKAIKTGSNKWMALNRDKFPEFESWQNEYAALTNSFNERQRIIDYIIGQQEHHKRVSYFDEIRELLKEAGLEFDEKYLK